MTKSRLAIAVLVAVFALGAIFYATLVSPFQVALKNEMLTRIDMGVLLSATAKIDRSKLLSQGQDIVFDPGHQETLIRILTTACMENGQQPLTKESFLRLKGGKITSASGQELTILLDANNDGQCFVDGLGQVSSKRGAIVFYKEGGLYLLAN